MKKKKKSIMSMRQKVSTRQQVSNEKVSTRQKVLNEEEEEEIYNVDETNKSDE